MIPHFFSTWEKTRLSRWAGSCIVTWPYDPQCCKVPPHLVPISTYYRPFKAQWRLWSARQLNVNWGVPKGGGDGKEVHLPWHYFGLNKIHRPLQWPQTGTWYSGLQENMHTDGVWCVPLLTSSPSLRISQISALIPISWVVMNIINGIARGADHVHLSHQVWPQRSERCRRGAPVNVACAECTQMCTVGGRIQGLNVT